MALEAYLGLFLKNDKKIQDYVKIFAPDTISLRVRNSLEIFEDTMEIVLKQKDKMVTTLLPCIQVHALIYVAEA